MELQFKQELPGGTLLAIGKMGVYTIQLEGKGGTLRFNGEWVDDYDDTYNAQVYAQHFEVQLIYSAEHEAAINDSISCGPT